MIAIPTVALRDGRCIVPAFGPDAQRVGAAPLDEPVAVIRALVNDGFERLHVLDLDALSGSGSSQSEPVLLEMLRDGAAEFDVTAGVQSIERAQTLFDAGARRLVVGSRALEEPDWLIALAELFPDVIVLASHVRERQVVTRGWLRRLPTDVLDLVSELRGLPLGAFLISSMNLDGEHRALDLALLEDIVDSAGVPVLAAGPFDTAADLRALEHRGVAGAVLGAPLYTGQLDPRMIAQEFA